MEWDGRAGEVSQEEVKSRRPSKAEKAGDACTNWSGLQLWPGVGGTDTFNPARQDIHLTVHP